MTANRRTRSSQSAETLTPNPGAEAAEAAARGGAIRDDPFPRTNRLAASADALMDAGIMQEGKK
jgi:hypothetical protein